MQSVSRPPFQQQPHRQQPPPNPNQQQHVGAPREIYYTQPGPSNRLILSLLSPDADSIDWALNQLVRLSASPFFDLTAWPQALSALLRHPLQLIEFGQSNRGGLASSQQASLWEAGLGAGELVVEMRRRATESLLVLKNAGVVNDKANGELLGESSRLMSFVEDLLTFDRDVLLDHLVEPLLLSLDILYNIATSAHPSSLLRSSCNSTSLPAALIPLLDKTQNAAVLLALFRLINAVTVPNEHSSSSRNNPNNNPTQLIRKRPREADSDSDPDSSQPVPQLSAQVSPFVPLSHPTLPPAFLHKSLLILALPPYPRNQLIRSAALDFLYTYTTHSHHASVLLQRSDVGAIFRLLARGLFEGCVEKEVKMPDVRDIEEHEGPLTPEEIRYLTKMAEPARSKAWIKRVWASAPLTSQVAQVVFWQDYRATFQALPAGSPPLSTASEIIRLFTDSIETARPATIKDFNGPGLDGYVIQGVQKKTAIPMDHSATNASKSLFYFPLVSYRRLLSTTIQTGSNPNSPPSPSGNSFCSALVLRNLARAIVELLHEPPEENEDATGGSGGGGEWRGMGKEGKEKKLREGEMFGLPIPEGLMVMGQGQGKMGASRRETPMSEAGDEEGEGDEEKRKRDGEEEEEEEEKVEEVELSEVEAMRAKGALKSVEDLVLDWVVRGDELGGWLGEVLEAISLMEQKE